MRTPPRATTKSRAGSVSQDAGLWMLNDVSCPEVEGLMDAFKKMSTVVKFANTSLESGNVEVAHQSYTEALILFKKLKKSRGVSWGEFAKGCYLSVHKREPC